MMPSRTAIAQYEATVVLIVVSLSLASIVYQGLKPEANLGSKPIFVNDETIIGGDPTIERVVSNSSSSTVISSFSVDAASSNGGILALIGATYSSSPTLCTGSATTFFSVLARQAGSIQIATDGRPWVSGSTGASIQVSAGWHEVMIVNGTTCSISLPGGEVVSGPWSPASTTVSPVPVDGNPGGITFAIYLPTDGNPHSILMTFGGGFDAFEI
ncbi:MAG: hypothetical protein OK455_00625 [Thaumarchaeota archaeon]|nr:hypothetical protein [Nitrososphaerota archaeon]